MEELIQKIERLKKENDFVILAHYYVDGAVQDIADYVGDSFYLSKVATEVEAKNINPVLRAFHPHPPFV